MGTLNAILPKEFRWTGKHVEKWNDFYETFLIRHYYKPLSSSPTLLYVPSNLLTSSEMRSEDISLLAPTTKLPQCRLLDYPSLSGNPPCIGK